MRRVLDGASCECADNKHTIGLLMLQGLSQYVGVSFYLALIQRFGGVVAVCVTSCRKVRWPLSLCACDTPVP